MRSLFLATVAAMPLFAAVPSFAQGLRMGDSNTFTSTANVANQSITATGSHATAIGSVAALDVTGGLTMGSSNKIMLSGTVKHQNVSAGAHSTAMATVGGINSTNGAVIGSNNVIVTSAKVGEQTVQSSGYGAIASGTIGGINVH